MAVLSALFRGFIPLSAAVATLALSGCNEHVSPAASTSPAPGAQIVASGYSPRPAAIAITQMEGAPAPLQSQFMAYFNAAAAQQDVALTDSAAARYLVRGYISAFPVDGGARLTCVWDIYDRTNHRAQRLNDEIALRGAAPDPWSLADSAALAALAQRSASELAAFLSNTPEALAATAQNAGQNANDAVRNAVAPASSEAAPRQALSYAPAR
jgi:hypothetical protein